MKKEQVSDPLKSSLINDNSGIVAESMGTNQPVKARKLTEKKLATKTSKNLGYQLADGEQVAPFAHSF